MDKSIIYYKICHPEGVGTEGAYDEGTFSLSAAKLNRATSKEDFGSRLRSLVMLVYGFKVYFSSLTLPQNDNVFGWLLMRKLRNINNNSALAERTLPSPLMGLRGKRDTFGYPALAHWATSHGPLTGSEKMTRVLNLGVVFDYV